MKNRRFLIFYLLSCIGVIAASYYPLLMGVRTVGEMLQNGAVPMENYPKYIIPYTPIAISLVLGVVMMPIFDRIFKRFSFLGAAVFSTGAFFLLERLMETKILVQTTEIAVDTVPLESWQMSLCYVPPERYQTRTWEAVDVLLGGYSPMFKLHFYIISVVIILSFLNCFYGFGKMLRSGDRGRLKALVVQAAASAAFLGMCIWACFTSFYRTGEIVVSVRSAVLMAVFFIVFGMTMGAFAGSFTLGRKWQLSVLLPAVIASLVSFVMYIGEMILLSGNLYRFGEGFVFEGIRYIVLAPVDIAITLLSGCFTALIFALLNKIQKN